MFDELQKSQERFDFKEKLYLVLTISILWVPSSRNSLRSRAELFCSHLAFPYHWKERVGKDWK